MLFLVLINLRQVFGSLHVLCCLSELLWDGSDGRHGRREYEEYDEDSDTAEVILGLLGLTNGILTLMIGVVGLKGIRNRSPAKAKKMFKRGVCLVVSIFVISLVMMISRFALHVREGGYEYGDDEAYWPENDDQVFIEDNNIEYIQGDVIEVIGHVEYEEDGAVITIDMSWDSEQAQNLDWSQIFFDLFEKGNDFAQSLPQGSSVTITIVDNNGAYYSFHGEKDWYEPPAMYEPMDEEEWDEMDEEE